MDVYEKHREHGGVNPALVVFIALTVGFAVATVIVYNEYYKLTQTGYSPDGSSLGRLPNIRQGVTERENFIRKIEIERKELESSLEACKNQLSAERKAHKQTHVLLDTERDRAKDLLASVNSLQTRLDDVTKSGDDEAMRLREELTALKTEKDREIARLNNDITRLSEKKRDLEMTLVSERKDGSMRAATLETKINELNQRLAEIRQQKEKEKESLKPDGTILVSNLEHDFVEIDIGARDGVTNGLRFKVFELQKGGLRHEKGMIQITAVHDRTSRGAILHTNDSLNPMLDGDLISNPAFHVGAQKHFVIKGEHKTHTAEELAKLIEEAGSVVDADLSVTTDFLVRGDEVSDIDIQKALSLGVEIIQEEELLEYLTF